MDSDTNSDTSSSSSSASMPKSIYKIPERAIFDEGDLERFRESLVAKEILEFIKACADAVVGRAVSSIRRSDGGEKEERAEAPEGGVEKNEGEGKGESGEVGPIVQGFEKYMSRLFDLVDECPPIAQPMRYGNKAFRQWHARLCALTPEFLRSLLPVEMEDREGLIAELSPYICGMFGNEIRIDYGTGHEMGFALFFLCLSKLQLIHKSDLPSVVLVGFVSYLRTMRRLQMDYMLEPAGSHGVWGLDDYHCLTFVWGAAQLIQHPSILPSSIHNRDVLEEMYKEYIYLEGIRFIRKLKSAAPFAETSPMLNDISGVPEWAKITVGLLKLFQNEVLFKRVVVQHNLFGSLLKCTWEISKPDVRSNVQTMDFSTMTPGTATAMRNASVHPSVLRQGLTMGMNLNNLNTGMIGGGGVAGGDMYATAMPGVRPPASVFRAPGAMGMATVRPAPINNSNNNSSSSNNNSSNNSSNSGTI